MSGTLPLALHSCLTPQQISPYEAKIQYKCLLNVKVLEIYLGTVMCKILLIIMPRNNNFSNTPQKGRN